VLTGEQQAAAYADAPALVITAPAGTGKTEVLVRRAEQFVNDPASGYKRVLVVTYTTRAAAEFTSRLQGSLGPARPTKLVPGYWLMQAGLSSWPIRVR